MITPSPVWFDKFSEVFSFELSDCAATNCFYHFFQPLCQHYKGVFLPAQVYPDKEFGFRRGFADGVITGDML
jgi:hypothetical protein